MFEKTFFEMQSIFMGYTETTVDFRNDYNDNIIQCDKKLYICALKNYAINSQRLFCISRIVLIASTMQ